MVRDDTAELVDDLCDPLTEFSMAQRKKTAYAIERLERNWKAATKSAYGYREENERRQRERDGWKELAERSIAAEKAIRKERDRLKAALLRAHGCKCGDPLFGERPGVGPRCRLCNVVAPLQETDDGK